MTTKHYCFFQHGCWTAENGMEDQSTEAEILQPTNRSRITEVFLPPWNPKLPRVFFYALVEFQTYFCDRLIRLLRATHSLARRAGIGFRAASLLVRLKRRRRDFHRVFRLSPQVPRAASMAVRIRDTWDGRSIRTEPTQTLESGHV